MEKVILREITINDLELIHNWRSSDEINKFMYTDVKSTLEDQYKWFEKIQSNPSCKYWMIEFDGKPLGVANIVNINHVFDSCDWAFYLGDTSIRGKGIGSKVEYLVIEHVFNVIGLNKLNCEVIEFNANVIKMHEKFGFRREAFYREHFKKSGEYHNVIGLGLLKREWEIIKPTLNKKIYG